MKLFSTLSGYLSRAKKSEWDDYWYQPISIPSISGTTVNETEALKNTAVWACVRVISETVASLPLHVYRRMKNGGKKKAMDHPLYAMLHHKPNEEMTAFQWREVGMAHLLLWGNWYSQIVMDSMGAISGIWPLNPAGMSVERVDNTTEIRYRYHPTSGGEEVVFPAEQILHVPGLGFNGVSGYSPIEMAREAIGIGKSADEMAARFYANDATPGGVLEHPGKLSLNAQENLRKTWTNTHGGLANKYKPAILEEGMKFTQLSMPLKDAQFLETRKFQVEEICRFFRVPPHMIGDLSRATYSNIEQQSIDFVVNTIRPWLVRIEQAMMVKLFGNNKRVDYFAEHSVDGLLRGDSTARANYYTQMWNIGVFSINDILSLENMNPIEDGDQHFVPINNMAPLEKIDEVLAAKNAPPPAPAPTEPEPSEEEENEEEERLKAIEIEKRKVIDETYRKWLLDNAEKLLRREEIAVKRAIKKKNYEAYSKDLEEFYANLPKFINDTFLPAISAHNAMTNSTGRADLNAWASEYIQQSKNDLSAWETSLITKDNWMVNSTAYDDKLESWKIRPQKAVEIFVG